MPLEFFIYIILPSHSGLRLTQPLRERNKEKVKESHYRPGQVLRVPRVLGSHTYISRPSAREGDTVVSPSKPAAVTLQEILLVLIYARG
jgi:hypothetical protein